MVLFQKTVATLIPELVFLIAPPEFTVAILILILQQVFSCSEVSCAQPVQIGSNITGTALNAFRTPAGVVSMALRVTSDGVDSGQGFVATWGAAWTEVCGDKLRDAGEGCDDGNTAGGYISP